MVWHPRAYQQRIKLGWKWLSAAVRAHRVALVFLGVACAVGQLNALTTGPLVVSLPDTASYLAVTHKILTRFQFFDAWRSPGYPTFLALVFVLVGGQHLRAVAIAQICLMLLAMFEIYGLTFRITHARWQACLVASLCALNPFVLAWEHTITSETLTYWLVVTLFLVFERYLRRRSNAWLAWLAVLLVAIVLTRPQFVFMPALLAMMLVIWRWRSGARGRTWKEIGIVAGVPCLLILAYCAGNARVTGYFGLSDVANVSLFGKVVEYQMFDASGPATDPRFDTFRAAVHMSEAKWADGSVTQDSWHVEGFVWTFVDQHPEFGACGRAIYGSYSVAIIAHHPREYAQKSLPDVVAAAYAAPVYFAAPGYATPRNLWLAGFFTVLARIAAFLPLMLVYAIWSILRRPRDVAAMLCLTMLIALGATIVVGAFTDFAEFWRIRFPLDWIMTLAFILMLVLVVRTCARWLARARQRLNQTSSRIAHKAP